eukprot:GHVS01039811.1.p1 GENE.GHVS01039811.1~~GHVS01039811.1.p1  ORF type:complete len:327 (-),score=23.24 GHVS01039811.1:46-1026(-)
MLPKRIIAVTYRRALADYLSTVLDFKCYNEWNAVDGDCQYERCVVCINSLCKLPPYVHYDLVLIDEAAFVLFHLLGETMEGRQKETIVRLSILMKDAGKAILCQEKLPLVVCEYYRRLTGADQQSVQKILVDTVVGRPVLHLYRRLSDLLTKILFFYSRHDEENQEGSGNEVCVSSVSCGVQTTGEEVVDGVLLPMSMPDPLVGFCVGEKKKMGRPRKEEIMKEKQKSLELLDFLMERKICNHVEFDVQPLEDTRKFLMNNLNTYLATGFRVVSQELRSDLLNPLMTKDKYVSMLGVEELASHSNLYSREAYSTEGCIFLNIYASF